MDKRPKIKIELTSIDTILEIVGWFLLLTIWLFTITNYNKLPDIIPTHYSALGQADGFGGKTTILRLPVVATILYIGLTILNNFPHIFNYPTSINDENARRQYTNATKMIRILKLVILLIFGSIIYTTIQNGAVKSCGLGMWFLPSTLILIYIPLIYFLGKSFRTK